jgi:membrane-associated protein
LSSLASGLINLHGWVAYAVIAALVFGETAIFVGFVLPGEIAAVLGGVLASRGHVSLPLLIVIVVAAAVIGPFVGYEVGKRMGDRLFQARQLNRVRGGVDRARTVLSNRGGTAVFFGRFIAVVRAIMPAAAGAARVPYRTFAVYNVAGGVIWGAGYCLVGYLAGSAYAAVERRVGTGLAIALGTVVVIGVGVWLFRRHQAQLAGPADPGAPAAGTAPAADADQGADAEHAAGGEQAGVQAPGGRPPGGRPAEDERPGGPPV